MLSNCLNCDKEYCYQPSQSGGKFCSNICQGEYQIKKRFDLNIEFNNRMAHYLKKIRGNKCEECGLTEWCGKPLTCQIDHINGNRKDNRFDNLRILCPNCHSQCKTWGIGNISEEGKVRLLEGAKKGGKIKNMKK